ncbi:hypothetical protein P886_4440 [Alteromonadaceae bacterium 2753L.S.0a.02]|nr:hypothetical protein P886_4440 [Alteromonadaceae bacterium 2753L.S.0a.02]
MSPPDGESRKLARAEVQQVILVRDAMRDVEIGRIVNLHEEGFMVIGGNEVRENCLYQLKFELTDPVDGINLLDIGAECLWVRETAGEDRNWSGFHILDIAADDVAIISKLKKQIDQ